MYFKTHNHQGSIFLCTSNNMSHHLALSDDVSECSLARAHGGALFSNDPSPWGCVPREGPLTTIFYFFMDFLNAPTGPRTKPPGRRELFFPFHFLPFFISRRAQSRTFEYQREWIYLSRMVSYDASLQCDTSYE